MLVNEQTNVKVRADCDKCSGFTLHTVVKEHKISLLDCIDEDVDVGWQIIECCGCQSIRFRSYEEIDVPHTPSDGQRRRMQVKACVFPNARAAQALRQPGFAPEIVKDSKQTLVPCNVIKMYRETLSAYNCHIHTLAGLGLRTVVEAVCLDRGIKGGSLEAKIDKLVELKHLTAAQAALLHEERYLGNAAAHEIATPERQDLIDGLEIIEGLLNTLYILPHKAEQMRLRRTQNTDQA